MLQSIVETGLSDEQLQLHNEIVTKCQAVIIGLENADLGDDPIMADAEAILVKFVEFSRSCEAG